MKAKYVLVNNFRCRTCGDVVLSLSVHDYRECSCGNHVDGGFDYIKRGGNHQDMQVLPLYWKRDIGTISRKKDK
jgi:hypothetical protein